ncbi:MAG: glutaredoxin domain-containing protein [Planctomycetota bacterium]|nr:glutaredoxin domain-containing protein [Planctomycetota bacterium]MDA0933162.1 glutaredoxin domain-containing protein [Planctomycetota bacterium]MDA1220992.1 glutaredoxin domain-containing protein [Planctomycetota bacterium]
MWNTDDIRTKVAENKILIFAKGSKEQPMCGFSHRAIAIVSQLGQPFEVVNIFDDASIRPALVEAYGWPTTPQVFVAGELLGGSDIVMEMFESGELKQKVDAAFAAE